MKKLPTLYSKNSNGSIQQWTAHIDGNKYRYEYGQVGGKLFTTEWTSVSGKNTGKKNETSGEEQAEKEARADWKKKMKLTYTDDITKVDSCTAYIEPILAKNYKDHSKKVDFSTTKWGVQTKFNGVCCVASVAGAYSRKGEKFVAVPHLVDCLAEFFKEEPNAVLHGELFNDDLREKLNELIHIVRQTKDITSDLLAESEKIVRFYIYDGYFPDSGLGEDAPYWKRKAKIDQIVKRFKKYCVEVVTKIVSTKTELDEIFLKAIERGDEGVILRYIDMEYIHDRSDKLLKYKPVDSDECIVKELKYGTAGMWTKCYKTATIVWKDKIFDATFKGSLPECTKINPKDFLDKQVTFLYNGINGKGTPNFARIDVKNCFRAD